jgi:hypothetical protein
MASQFRWTSKSVDLLHVRRVSYGSSGDESRARWAHYDGKSSSLNTVEKTRMSFPSRPSQVASTVCVGLSLLREERWERPVEEATDIVEESRRENVVVRIKSDGLTALSLSLSPLQKGMTSIRNETFRTKCLLLTIIVEDTS